MRVSIIGVAVCLTLLACTGGHPPEDEMSGTWRLAAVCTYDRGGPPCVSVPDVAAEELTFQPGWRYVRIRPDEEGAYALERRATPAGGEEILIRFDGGSPAQLHNSQDSLVVSWAYLDGPERRYVRGTR